jgi:hypothetical protein
MTSKPPEKVIHSDDGTSKQIICLKCNKEQPRESFEPVHNQSQPPNLKKGCRDCRHLHDYGITKTDFDKEMEKQDGQCLLCEEKIRKSRMEIERDEENKEVKGIFCPGCYKIRKLWKSNPEQCVRFVKHNMKDDNHLKKRMKDLSTELDDLHL